MVMMGENIGAVQFGVLSPEDIENGSVVCITTEKTFDQNQPVPNGLFDMRMGVLDAEHKCQTCQHGMRECVGHPGHIELAKPVYNILFVHYVVDILRCICPHCYRILLDKKNPKYKKIMKIPDPSSRIKALLKATEGTKICGNVFSDSMKSIDSGDSEGCGEEIPTYKLVDKIKVQCEFSKINPKFNKKQSQFFMSAEKARNILRRIDDCDLHILGCNPVLVKPHWMILTMFPVPPPVVRPSNTSNAAARGEDDLTHRLEDIVRFNNIFKKNLESPVSQEVIDTMTQVLQAHISMYFDNESLGQMQNSQASGKPKKDLRQRLEKKEGRIRGNLMGKRLDFTARMVISPDTNIGTNEIGIPTSVAKILTFPETVTEFNISKLITLIERGPEGTDTITNKYKGGANYVEDEDGNTISLKIVKFPKEKLKIGMVVGRHMMDGDVVLMNRQPSLHKVSIMAHKVRIMLYSVIRLPPQDVTPYNADYDGDEMNLIFLQSYQSQAIAWELMRVDKCILTPQSNRPVIGLVQNGLLGMREMTSRDVFLTKEQVMQMVMVMEKWDGKLPIPAIQKSQLNKEPLWTGKQVFSMILPNIKRYKKIALFHDESEKTSGCGHRNNFEDFSTGDTIVIIQDGELLAGNMCKRSLGPTQGSLIHITAKDFGADEIKRFVDDCVHLSDVFLDQRPNSIGYSDVRSDTDVKKMLVPLLKRARDEIDGMVKKGVSRKELETRSNKMLNDLRKKLAEKTIKNLPRDNGFRATLTAGSKGSAINPSLMVTAIGQQNVEGSRIPDGYEGRPLSHFTKFCYGPIERGFIPENYVKGLGPVSFIFHSMSGREGLIDTAVKTSRSGYIARKLGKALEDLKPVYDGTVRNEKSDVIQFSYGEDGMDGSELESQTVDTFNISDEDLAKMFKWTPYQIEKEKISLDHDLEMIKREWERLLRDQQNGNGKKEKTLALPCHFVRLIDSIPRMKDSPRMAVGTLIDETIALQETLWKSLPKGTETWDSPFAMTLRCNLSSKNLVQRLKITRKEWDWLKENVVRKFNKCIVAPGESVGTVAAQSIGEPATQMSVDRREGVVIYFNNRIIYRGEIGEFVDNLLNLDRDMDINKRCENGDSVVLDISTKQYFIDSVLTDSETRRETMTRQKITEVSRHMANGPMVKIQTKTGRTVKCTASHSFLRRSETQQIVPVLGRYLKIGDRVPVAIQVEQNAEPEGMERALYPKDSLFGQIVGCHLASPVLDLDSTIMLPLLNQTMREEIDILSFEFPGTWTCVKSVVMITSPSLVRWLNKFVGSEEKTMRIPKIFFESSSESRNMSRGLIAGYVSLSTPSKGHSGFHVSCANNILVDQIILLAYRLGVKTKIKNDNVVTFDAGDYFERILTKNLPHDKQHKVNMPLGLDDTFSDSIPFIGKLIAECAEEVFGHKNNEFEMLRTQPETQRDLLAQCIKKLSEETASKQNPIAEKKLKELTAILHSDIIWDEIVSVEHLPDPKEYVYDFTVEESNTFMVNSGIVVHNTLNTFHHVGQSEKNITLGVPRLEEITNCAKKPKTPSMIVMIKKPICFNKEAVLSIMQRMERLFMKDIVLCEEIFYDPDTKKTLIEDDKEIVNSFLHASSKPLTDDLIFSQYILRYSMNARKMREHSVKLDQVVDFIKEVYSDTVNIEWNDEYCDPCIIRIRPVSDKKVQEGEDAYLCTEMSKRLLTDVPIHGIDQISRTFLQQDKSTKEYYIETDGSNMTHIVNIPEIDWTRTITNDIQETLKVLGIEACRSTMLKEIVAILSFDSGYVNIRHPSLLCDNITHMGVLTSVSRHGINRADTGPLFKSSFEETVEKLVEAARFAQRDNIKGPTAHIITGSTPEFGTNAFDVHLDIKKLSNAVPIKPQPQTKQLEKTPNSTIQRKSFTVPSSFLDDMMDYTPSSSLSFQTPELNYRPPSPMLF